MRIPTMNEAATVAKTIAARTRRPNMKWPAPGISQPTIHVRRGDLSGAGTLSAAA